MAGLSGRMGLHLFGEILEGGVGAQRDELSHHLGVAPTSGAVQRRVAVAVHLVQEAGARGKQPFADAQEAARGGVVLRDGQAAWAGCCGARGRGHKPASSARQGCAAVSVARVGGGARFEQLHDAALMAWAKSLFGGGKRRSPKK